jgi:hypothetical protein
MSGRPATLMISTANFTAPLIGTWTVSSRLLERESSRPSLPWQGGGRYNSPSRLSSLMRGVNVSCLNKTISEVEMTLGSSSRARACSGRRPKVALETLLKVTHERR